MSERLRQEGKRLWGSGEIDLIDKLLAHILSVKHIFRDEKEDLTVAIPLPELAHGPLLGSVRAAGNVRTGVFYNQQTLMGLTKPRLSNG